MAVLLSIGALLVAAPALGLSLKLLQADRASFDREIAIEQAWREITEHPEAFPATLQKDCYVGEDRIVTVNIQRLPAQGTLLRWRLSVSRRECGDECGEERWLSR